MSFDLSKYLKKSNKELESDLKNKKEENEKMYKKIEEDNKKIKEDFINLKTKQKEAEGQKK